MSPLADMVLSIFAVLLGSGGALGAFFESRKNKVLMKKKDEDYERELAALSKSNSKAIMKLIKIILEERIYKALDDGFISQSDRASLQQLYEEYTRSFGNTNIESLVNQVYFMNCEPKKGRQKNEKTMEPIQRKSKK